MSCRLLLLAQLQRAVVVDVQGCLDDVDRGVMLQQGGELVSLKRHSVKSFP